MQRKFEIGQKVVNDRGAWVKLKAYQHPSSFYHVWGFEHWSPTFAEGITSAESVTHMSRERIERQMSTWLRNR